jgi:signal transduction histidine kinase
MKPGSGLGLNIVNETTKMYGGSVNPDRSPLGGSWNWRRIGTGPGVVASRSHSDLGQ